MLELTASGARSTTAMGTRVCAAGRIRAALRPASATSRHLRGVLRQRRPGIDFGGRGRAGPQRGRDVAVEVSITLEEVLGGTTRELEVDAVEPCSRCNGKARSPARRSRHARAARARASSSRWRARCSARWSDPGVRSVRRRRAHRADPVRRVAAAATRSGPHAHGRPARRHRQRSARARHGARARRRAGRPAGRPVRARPRRAGPRFERHGEDLVTRLDVPFTDAALGGAWCRPSRARRRSRSSRAPSRARCCACASAACPRCGPAPG